MGLLSRLQSIHAPASIGLRLPVFMVVRECFCDFKSLGVSAFITETKAKGSILQILYINCIGLEV